MHFWDSIRWRVFTYYTTLIAAMIALLVGLHAMSVKENLEQLEEGKLRSHAVALLPVFFPPLAHGPEADRPPGQSRRAGPGGAFDGKSDGAAHH
jgi:hypothetical protein